MLIASFFAGVVPAKAALIVENGGGYDDFMTTMLQSAKSAAPVINAVGILVSLLICVSPQRNAE